MRAPALTFAILRIASANVLTIKSTPAPHANKPLEHFLSYSIEFSSFVDYAGNLSAPNTYSNNLLDNIAAYAGSKPLIRVGGNTQDLTTFNSSQKIAVKQNFAPSNPDYPANQSIGPAFFESYQTWPGVHFSHGFNLADSSLDARLAVLDSVEFACRTLRGKLYAWELGNEPDLYSASALNPFPPREPGYTESQYASEWLKTSRDIRTQMQKSCPDLATKDRFKFLAPSLAGSPLLSNFSAEKIFAAGLDDDRDISYVSQHKYIAARGDPGVTLQGTLMNHTNTIAAVTGLLAVKASIENISNKTRVPKNAPFILGEGNSLARQGIGGVSNSFGAALWGFDFALTLVANGIGRWHMHQGTNYRYQAWQPIETRNTTMGTKAPYYGNVAVSAFLGDLTKRLPEVVDLDLPGYDRSGFALYVGGRLEKIAVISLREYNATGGGHARPTELFTFQLPCGYRKTSLQRLSANGSDAITGVTFDGYSYAAELDNGKPVRLNNVTIGEQVAVRNGRLVVEVPRSSAVILNLH